MNMERLAKAQDELQASYDSFNELLAKKLPPLILSNVDSLKSLLDIVIRRESHCVLKKEKYPNKASAELRKFLADVLLLNDNVDFKQIKAKAKAETADNIES
ncbi:MAG: hypothetical protein ACI9LM_002488 [Alteromonadaceae bacterium]|jgi:hypothetical protein